MTLCNCADDISRATKFGAQGLPREPLAEGVSEYELGVGVTSLCWTLAVV